MPRILVNPGTSDAWEIQLQSGPNRIGSSENNDFQINHSSISGYHCEFILSDAGVLLRDLGSIRGTYINREKIQEAFLRPGQHIQIGSVAMIFEPAESGAAGDSAEVMVAAPTPSPPSNTVPASTPPLPDLKNVSCRNHPTVPARFVCNQCQSYFCAECVGPHATENCAPGTTFYIKSVRDEAPSFPATLPGALHYPFRYNGPIVLMAGTLVLAGLALLGGSPYAVLLQIAALCYLFAYLQSIVVATAAEKRVPAELPGAGEFGRAVVPFLGTTLISFGPALALAVAESRFQIELSPAFMSMALLFGCAYYPMALLAVSLKNSVAAANPLSVVVSIVRVSLIYVVPVILTIGVVAAGAFTVGANGEIAGADPTTQSLGGVLLTFAKAAGWSFLGVYLLIVTARVLGVLYVTRKQRLGWS